MSRKNPNKICSKCKEEKPVSEFISYKRGTRQGGVGVSSKCKICAEEYRKEWFKSDKGKENKKKYHLNLKKTIISEYSNNENKCSCCGEMELLFLTIDHINNDGAEDRKKTGSGAGFYRYLKRNNFPNKDKYQVLCFNCNHGKQINGGVCPHKR